MAIGPRKNLKWTTLGDLRAWDLPHGGGCYAIYIDGALAYIGQSSNLRARLATHKLQPSYGPDFDTPWGYAKTLIIKVKLYRRYGEWAMTELRLIKRLQPPLNCAFSTRKRALNVKA